MMMTETTANNVFDELQHLQCLGLNGNPFPVAPDNHNFFLSAGIDRVTANILHGILARKGFLVLTGDIGLGKTTVSRRIMDILEQKDVATSLVLHSTYRDVELLQEINRDFGLKVNSRRCSDQIRVLNRFLLERSRKGKNSAIVIDDAQNLNRRSLELIRMISNLEADRQKLVQILLVGQTELMQRLNASNLRQLKSRVMIHEIARPLDRNELAYYLTFKLNAVGSSGQIKITPWALRRIQRLTGGNLRRINVLMDRCLYALHLFNTTVIDRRLVSMSHKDLALDRRRFRLPRWALSAAAGLAATIFAAGILLQAVTGQTASGTRVVHRKIEGPIPAISSPDLSDAATTTGQTGAASGTHAIVSMKSVSRLLAAHRLTAYTRELTDALRIGSLQKLAARMVAETGYELVSLRRLPTRLEGKYDLIRYWENPGGGERYLLLWQPPLKLTRYFDAYRGSEIAQLQDLLVRQRLYEADTDGIVGPKLKRAVSRFQRQMQLPDTGYPDGPTVFYLCHQERIDQG